MELEDAGKLLGVTWGKKTFTFTSEFSSCVSSAGVTLHGKYHFLKGKGNNVKLKRTVKTLWLELVGALRLLLGRSGSQLVLKDHLP